MIGQSGLPMMNNLAGSKDNAPEESRAKSAPAEAGAFEKVLMPDAQAFADALKLEGPAEGQKELPKTRQRPSLIDANTAKSTIARTEADPALLVSPQHKTPTDGEIPMTLEFTQQSVEPIAAANGRKKGELSTRQLPDARDQIPLIASEGSEYGLQLSKAENPVTLPFPSVDDPRLLSVVSPDSLNTQAAELDTKATPPEFVQPPTEAKTNELSDQPGNPILETNKLVSSPDSPEFRATSADLSAPRAIVPVDGTEARPSQQASPVSTALLPDRGSEAVAATQSRGDANAELTGPKAERPKTSALLAAIQLSEKNVQPPQSQAEVVQNRLTPFPSFSELRSAAAWAGAAPSSDSAPISPAGYPMPTEGGVLKAMVSSPTPQFLTVTPETPFLAQSALSDQSEILLGTSTSITSTASTRHDAPVAAPVPSSADAKLVIQQINQAIIRMDGARTEIMLDPVELGRVSLTFIAKDEGVTVLINADRPETADLLRRNGEQLQRDLSSAGYEDVELDFDQGDDDHPDPSAADGFDDTGTARSSSVSYEANFVTSGLDIRI